MSTADTDASGWSVSQDGGLDCETTCVFFERSVTTPNVSLSIHFHICAATTVGIAQGTSITARMTPRPLKLELTTSATIRPSTNSKDTVSSVNLSVTQIEFRKSVSCQRSL